MVRNVLICTTQVPFTTGGGESHVEGLRQALISHGYNAEVIAVPFKWYPPTEIMRGALAWRLLDVSSANGKPIDLVIGMKFPAYLAKHENKVLWVMHQHRSAYNLWGTAFDDLSTYPEGPRIREWIKNCDERFIPAAKKVFANSKTVAERLLRYNNIESEPLYHPPPRATSLKTGDQDDYVFYPSRIEPQKRQELLIEAARFLKSPIKIVLAGSCANLKHYESLIKKFDVTDRIVLRGFVSDAQIVELYANALAVCYLPFDEDYGYVTLEGMLSAKPVVVASDGGGATEFIEHKSEGLITSPEPKAIAEAIDSLHFDRAQASTMGNRAFDKIKSLNLSWSNVVARLVDVSITAR